MGLLDLTPEQSAYIGDVGMGLLSASGPSRMPVSLGQALAGGMQMANQNERQRMQDKMAREEFDAQRAYRALQERQLSAALAKQARQEEMQQQFLRQFGQMAQGAPQVVGRQFNPGRDESNTRFEMGTPNAQADFMKAAQMLATKQQSGQTLTPDETMFLDQVRSRISPVTQNVPDARGMAQMGAAGQMLGIPGAKAAYEYAKDFEKPDWQAVDVGGQIQYVNRNAGQMPTIGKTMSPEAVASNQLGRERLSFDIGQASRPNLQHIEGADGLYAYDPRTGTAAPVVNPENGRPVQGGKGLTEAQGKATTFAMRAQEASKILDEVGKDGKVQPGMFKRGVEAIPYVGDSLGTMANFTQSAPQQQVEQAQRDFINAVLRLESGAAISPSEFDNARKQYFPQPGDSNAVIAQKKANRDAEIRGLTVMSGPGARHLGGQPQSTISGGGWSATVVK